jgi:uncharacterized protein DUF3309
LPLRTTVAAAKRPWHAIRYNRSEKESNMLGTLLIIVLVLLLVGALPRWGYSRSWGYAPTGILGVVLLIIVILLLTGRL